MTTSALPFDDVRALVQRMPPAGDADRAESGNGQLDAIVAWLARWQHRDRPRIDRPMAAIFAGTHGVAIHGVSAHAQTATAQMMQACQAGEAPINRLCDMHDVGLKLFDLALDHPSEDITMAPALDERACAGTIAFGMEAVAGGADLLCVGDIGVGGTTAAAAVAAALFGGDGAQWVGPGSGLDAVGIAHKGSVVDQALAVHQDHIADPLEALRRLGGREMAAMAGAILAARFEQCPVIIDGFVASVAAAVLFKLDAKALDHCLFAHVSAEPGHRRLLAMMGKDALLDLAITGGAGVGALLAVPLVKSALAMCPPASIA